MRALLDGRFGVGQYEIVMVHDLDGSCNSMSRIVQRCELLSSPDHCRGVFKQKKENATRRHRSPATDLQGWTLPLMMCLFSSGDVNRETLSRESGIE